MNNLTLTFCAFREHAMLAKTAGVKHLVVLVNKMDDPTVEWAESRLVFHEPLQLSVLLIILGRPGGILTKIFTLFVQNLL